MFALVVQELVKLPRSKAVSTVREPESVALAGLVMALAGSEALEKELVVLAVLESKAVPSVALATGLESKPASMEQAMVLVA